MDKRSWSSSASFNKCLFGHCTVLLTVQKISIETQTIHESHLSIHKALGCFFFSLRAKNWDFVSAIRHGMKRQRHREREREGDRAESEELVQSVITLHRTSSKGFYGFLLPSGSGGARKIKRDFHTPYFTSRRYTFSLSPWRYGSRDGAITTVCICLL